MRLETQKQIVKAFTMLYEDTDMPLSELIEKLQQLNSPAQASKKAERDFHYNPIRDDEIFEALKSSNEPMRISEIAAFLKVSNHNIEHQLRRLSSSEKIKRITINSKLYKYCML